MNKGKCLDCYYFDDGEGTCHRHPPVEVGIYYNVVDKARPRFGWPPTEFDEYCGEFREKET